jgi:hypothetical protein
MGLGETDTSTMRFPLMSLADAMSAFSRAAYGTEIELEHA